MNEDETNEVSNFTIENKSLVPIKLNNIKIIKNGDWYLENDDKDIPKNNKSMELSIDNQVLILGDNLCDIYIPEKSSKKLNIKIKRGVWTKMKYLIMSLT